MTLTDTSVYGLSAEELAATRAACLDDPFIFARFICGHKDLTPKLHMPLLYVAAGLVDKLVPILNSPDFADSYTVRQIKRELLRHSVDWNTPFGRQRMVEIFRFVNIRVSRGFGKSSSITHGLRLWKMTKDPNLTAALITNVDDPKAKDFCKQIRATILSDRYRAIFPDRVPEDLKLLQESRITLAGRTVPDMEPCLMAFGYAASPVGYHFDELHFDDLVARENSSLVALAEVRDFLANLSGLYKPGFRYPIVRMHVGTRWDDEDDDAEVRKIARCFTINVPIWYRDAPTDDITIAGTPTAPDWKDLENIKLLQEEVLSNPQEGAIAWRCNYELDPSAGGGRIFPSNLVDASDWIPYRPDPKYKSKFAEWPSRLIEEKETRKTLAFDPEKLYVVTACDQSFASDGDEWSVASVGCDQYGHRYVLEVRTGHGVEAMLDAVEMQRLTWKPRRIGFEKIAAQHVIELVVKLGVKYRMLRGSIESVSHNNKPKEWRLRNFVAEMLKMRRLHLNPRDTQTKAEMKAYKPGPKAKDNILDALAMCEVLIQKSSQSEAGQDAWQEKLRRINADHRAALDPFTGVPRW